MPRGKKRKSQYKGGNHWIKILIIAAILLALPLMIFIATQKSNDRSHAQTAPANFLTRNGKTLMLNGKPFKFTGFDAFGLEGCEGETYSDSDLNAYFSSLQPNSLTRTDAFQSYGLTPVDAIVKSAEANNQMLILILADGQSQCNDSDGANGGDGSGKSAAWYQGGFRTNYIPWVKQVVTKYKNSKAIGMWELINEPNGVPDATMKTFFDETAADIKAIDPNHLVESGSQAEYVQGTTDYALVHSGPNIDVASLHEYDYDYNNSKVIESGHFQPILDAMNSINKPLIIGEVGVNGATSGCTSLADRANVFKQKFDTYLSKGAAGVVIWNWSKADHTSECSWWVGPNDPLLALMRGYQPPGISGPLPSSAPGISTAPISPTFGVIAPCPSCSLPTATGTPPPAPSPTKIVIVPSSDIIQPAPSTAQPGNPNGGITRPGKPRGGLQSFIEFLLELLKQLLALLRGN